MLKVIKPVKKVIKPGKSDYSSSEDFLDKKPKKKVKKIVKKNDSSSSDGELFPSKK